MTKNNVYRVKKHKNGNEYLLAAGVWVRNFTRPAPPVDINVFTTPADRHLLIHNQLQNEVSSMLQFNTESIFRPNICIISDGYEFREKQALLKTLPDDVFLIATNRSLAKLDTKTGRKIDLYLVNNPYQECMSYLPSEHRYFPPCLSSIRTYPEFLQLYRGPKFKYAPTYEETFMQTELEASYHLDEYRNPICAAISLAQRLKAVKILLFCCDDSFAGERPGANKLHNGLWMYPQHLVPHNLIDGALYWFSHQAHRLVKVGSHSSGPDYDHVPYIPEEGLGAFFTVGS